MNILSLQGGGCLGYGQVLILEALEEANGKQCYEMFDLIAGTSVGSIIGAILAAGIPASNIKSFFTQDAPEIFSSNFLSTIGSLFNPKYSPANLESSLQSVLGNNTLNNCKTKFLATSYDWASDSAVYFHSWEPSKAGEYFITIGNDSNIPLWQICRASSAAQTYFPAFQFKDLVLLDGGNIGDNIPDVLCISEFAKTVGIDNMKMLSLGNGKVKWLEKANTMLNPSLITAGLKTVELLFSAGEDSRTYCAHKMLDNNYYRLSPDLGNGIAIDDAEGCLTLIPPAANKVIQDSVKTVFPVFK